MISIPYPVKHIREMRFQCAFFIIEDSKLVYREQCKICCETSFLNTAAFFDRVLYTVCVPLLLHLPLFSTVDHQSSSSSNFSAHGFRYHKWIHQKRFKSGTIGWLAS